MGELKAKLLAAAQLRTAKVAIDGEDYTVREGSAVVFIEYMSLLQVDRDRATATLLADCVVDADGAPLLTVDEAVAVARSARVSMSLMRAIMALSGFDEKEPDAG